MLRINNLKIRKDLTEKEIFEFRENLLMPEKKMMFFILIQ